MEHHVWLASRDDADAIGRLLYAFNREFDEPAPELPVLAERIRQLLDGGDTLVLLAEAGPHGDGPHRDGTHGAGTHGAGTHGAGTHEDGPDGVAVLRLRAAIWSAGLECYLAELYVTPARRGQGLGRVLMEAALREARDRGADTMDIGVDEPDQVARQLYESLGFSNRAGGDGPLMYVYERDL